jgi:hypothetical protein
LQVGVLAGQSASDKHWTHRPVVGSQTSFPPPLQSARVAHSTQPPVSELQIGAEPLLHCVLVVHAG